MASRGLQFLPVELLYEIQLLALSPSLPVISRHMQAVFRGTTPLYRAEYLMGRQFHHDIEPDQVLRYPLCSQAVLPHIMPMLREDLNGVPAGLIIFRLPKRLFRPLAPLSDLAKPRTESTHPLPLLKRMYYTADFARLDPNAYDGYALTRAVHANFVPLIRFLLALGADPGARDGLAVVIAIRRRDLALVRMLFERVPGDAQKRAAAGKQPRGDRVLATNAMLRTAVKCDARDIVRYFREEKGLVPNLRTLSMLPAFDAPAAARPAGSPLKRKRG
ncbi:hypothetical protein FIBSPDRAFT_1037269 [Athelia psychrophila]|uniref:Uncharacterized protein n=1 Tax=Athelia psychrophila TaxID=1759441 RepID=A0A166UHI7_9AGAM|nr:hypothetical protein FIBSPDRAFT_1037269 [Fibularhizoctonia sp. CBS 109695]